MARKWSLSDKNDYRTAVDYISRKLKNDIWFLEHHWDIELQEKGQREFYALAKKFAPDEMLQWIEKWLLPDQIKRLRTYLRVERSRSKKSQQNITIDSAVRSRLADYAKRNNVTLSGAIEKLLDTVDRQERLF